MHCIRETVAVDMQIVCRNLTANLHMPMKFAVDLSQTSDGHIKSSLVKFAFSIRKSVFCV